MHFGSDTRLKQSLLSWRENWRHVFAFAARCLRRQSPSRYATDLGMMLARHLAAAWHLMASLDYTWHACNLAGADKSMHRWKHPGTPACIMTFAGCGQDFHLHCPTSCHCHGQTQPLRRTAIASAVPPLGLRHESAGHPAHTIKTKSSTMAAQQQRNGCLAVRLLASLFLAAFTSTAEGESGGRAVCCPSAQSRKRSQIAQSSSCKMHSRWSNWLPARLSGSCIFA